MHDKNTYRAILTHPKMLLFLRVVAVIESDRRQLHQTIRRCRRLRVDRPRNGRSTRVISAQIQPRLHQTR